jgi:hypothetical protein
MIERIVWPEASNPIRRIKYALMTGFDPLGQPVYRRGEVGSAEERQLVQKILEPLRPVPHSITSVTMGEVTLDLADGSTVILRPVFRLSPGVYRDLFMVDEWQYPLPQELAELLEKWRGD